MKSSLHPSSSSVLSVSTSSPSPPSCPSPVSLSLTVHCLERSQCPSTLSLSTVPSYQYPPTPLYASTTQHAPAAPATTATAAPSPPPSSSTTAWYGTATQSELHITQKATPHILQLPLIHLYSHIHAASSSTHTVTHTVLQLETVKDVKTYLHALLCPPAAAAALTTTATTTTTTTTTATTSASASATPAGSPFCYVHYDIELIYHGQRLANGTLLTHIFHRQTVDMPDTPTTTPITLTPTPVVAAAAAATPTLIHDQLIAILHPYFPCVEIPKTNLSFLQLTKDPASDATMTETGTTAAATTPSPSPPPPAASPTPTPTPTPPATTSTSTSSFSLYSLLTPELLSPLIEMGFSQTVASKALLVNFLDVSDATEWIFNHMDDPSLDEPLNELQLQQLTTILRALHPALFPEEHRTPLKENKPKKITPQMIEAAVKKNLCTFTVTGPEFAKQFYYECITCRLVDGKGCCASCRNKCHAHHVLSSRVIEGSFFCDCGAGDCEFRCQSLHSDEEKEKDICKPSDNDSDNAVIAPYEEYLINDEKSTCVLSILTSLPPSFACASETSATKSMLQLQSSRSLHSLPILALPWGGSRFTTQVFQPTYAEMLSRLNPAQQQQNSKYMVYPFTVLSRYDRNDFGNVHDHSNYQSLFPSRSIIEAECLNSMLRTNMEPLAFIRSMTQAQIHEFLSYPTLLTWRKNKLKLLEKQAQASQAQPTPASSPSALAPSVVELSDEQNNILAIFDLMLRYWYLSQELTFYEDSSSSTNPGSVFSVEKKTINFTWISTTFRRSLETNAWLEVLPLLCLHKQFVSMALQDDLLLFIFKLLVDMKNKDQLHTLTNILLNVTSHPFMIPVLLDPTQPFQGIISDVLGLNLKNTVPSSADTAGPQGILYTYLYQDDAVARQKVISIIQNFFLTLVQLENSSLHQSCIESMIRILSYILQEEFEQFNVKSIALLLIFLIQTYQRPMKPFILSLNVRGKLELWTATKTFASGPATWLWDLLVNPPQRS